MQEKSEVKSLSQYPTQEILKKVMESGTEGAFLEEGATCGMPIG